MKIKLTPFERDFLAAILYAAGLTSEKNSDVVLTETIAQPKLGLRLEFDAYITKKGNLKGSRDSFGLIASIVGKHSLTSVSDCVFDKLTEDISMEEYITKYMGWAE